MVLAEEEEEEEEEERVAMNFTTIIILFLNTTTTTRTDGEALINAIPTTTSDIIILAMDLLKRERVDRPLAPSYR
jgi:hypothetical protein